MYIHKTHTQQSIFIGVISMGMFDAFIMFKEEEYAAKYVKSQAENTRREGALRKEKEKHSEVISLKIKIERALRNDSLEKDDKSTPYEIFVQQCLKIRNSYWFLALIIFTIVLIGAVSGIETNMVLNCSRVKSRANDDDDESLKCEIPAYINIIGILAQTIFTIECLIKIAAEGKKPLRYFTDAENGSWNILDFLIVLIGFVDFTPAKFIFAKFPVVILRLVRLFRVFKLAKPLPRLRSIVEALMSSFSAVGWVCILILVLNYIIGCLCIVFLRKNVNKSYICNFCCC
jgi:hypothetical protein